MCHISVLTLPTMSMVPFCWAAMPSRTLLWFSLARLIARPSCQAMLIDRTTVLFRTSCRVKTPAEMPQIILWNKYKMLPQERNTTTVTLTAHAPRGLMNFCFHRDLKNMNIITFLAFSCHLTNLLSRLTPCGCTPF